MQKMNTRLNDVESTQQSIVKNQQQLTERVECNETMVTELHERLSTMATANMAKSVTGKKNISNLHPGLKPIMQPIFFDLCGIDVKNTTRTKRIELLAKNDLLPNGDAFEMVNGLHRSGGRDGEKTLMTHEPLPRGGATSQQLAMPVAISHLTL
ncbi:hypothetical protein AZE42_03475 [Rhizopogon vesiculosus]|uniref:Uncharacterized protein n=1 Tax=Rhizopogon vesiculosus TaxID=180088 RepID=A0A1J8R871_9AGAM|nr:hypothetical protein AZE42_03475 [Rhizopogon vesiculosus]